MPLSLLQSILRYIAKLTAIGLAIGGLLVLEHQHKAAGGEARKPRVDLYGDPLPQEAASRIGSRRMRHGSPILHLAFSLDGKSIVSGAAGSICVWDVATGKCRWRSNFDAATDGCVDVVFRSDGILMASGGDDKKIITIRLLDPASGVVRRRMVLPPALVPSQLVFSRDGKRFAYSPDKNSVRICDATTGRETCRIPVQGNWIPSLAFSPDSRSIVFQHVSDTAQLYDATNGKKLREFKRQGDILRRPVFSPDGRLLASVSFTPVGKPGELAHVTVWDVATGKERHRLQSVSGDPIFSPDSKILALGCQNGEMVFWDMASGKELRRFSVENSYVGSVFSPDGKTLAASCGGGTIRLLDAATGKVLPASADPSLDIVTALRFSSDGRRLIGHAATYMAWEPTSGREIRRFATVPGPPWRLSLSPDDSLLASAEENGTIRLRDARTGKERRALKGHKTYIRHMIFSSDSRHLISSSENGTIRLWDVASGLQLHKMMGGGDRIEHLAISPDGRWLASASDSRGSRGRYEVILPDLAASQEKRLLLAGDNSPSQMAFSPDSRLLAAGSSGRKPNEPGIIQIWDVSSGGQRFSFHGHKSSVSSVAFSADGRMLASGRKRHEFVGHENMIFSLTFSPDGWKLAASSYDVPAYVWDVRGNTKPVQQRMTAKDQRRYWTALSGDDALAAFQAIRRLAAAPEQTLPFLRQQLKPVPAPDEKRVRQLVDMLDSDDFPTRQKATEELEKQADTAAGVLRQILAKENPSLEVRRRLQQILDSLGKKPESLRAARAVEVLEWIGTPEAVRLIGELAGGAADARLTREAVEAKRRLSR